jgi:hypothetical protein
MTDSTLKEKTAKGIAWGAVNNGTTQVLNLVFGIVLARLLDTEDYPSVLANVPMPLSFYIIWAQLT